MSVVTPLTPGERDSVAAEAIKDSYWQRCLVAFDVFCNVVLLKGQPDETISSHAGRAAALGKTWGIVLCKFLNLFQKNHGAIAQASDAGRAKNISRIEEEAAGE